MFFDSVVFKIDKSQASETNKKVMDWKKKSRVFLTKRALLKRAYMHHVHVLGRMYL